MRCWSLLGFKGSRRKGIEIAYTLYFIILSYGSPNGCFGITTCESFCCTYHLQLFLSLRIMLKQLKPFPT